jgi:SAM-dependent methyltransferase
MKPELDTYLSLCTQVYDISLPTPPNEEYTFFKSYALHAQGPILEPMCGTGRFLLPLMQDSFDVEGFDASAHMLATLHQKASKTQLKANVSLNFIENFKSDRQYHLIFIPSGSFNLITDMKEITAALTTFYDLLSEKGILLIEIITLEATPQNPGMWRRDRWDIDSNSFILASAKEEPLKENVSLTTCVYELVENNIITKTETEIIKIRLYSADEFKTILINAGFKKVTAIKAFDKTKNPDPSDKDIVFECQK